MRDVGNMMRVRAESRNLELVCELPAAFPRFVLADGPKLRQVLINLMGNAIKFTNVGSVTLRPSASGPDESGILRLRFEVEDTGVGIGLDDRQRIFEPFVQIGGASAQTGTGLGLTITRRFVEMMRGTLHIASEPGRGSCFTVEVPAEPAADSGDPAEPRPDTLFVLEPGQPECRVLIVEDNAESALLLEQMLTRAGFAVSTAADGAAGVEQFVTWRPHFIWMDLRMPVMGGADATRRIRELPGGPGIRIAAMSASAFASERDEVLAAGMDDFIRKPCRPGEVFDCMGRLLGVRLRPAEPEFPRPKDSSSALRPMLLPPSRPLPCASLSPKPSSRSMTSGSAPSSTPSPMPMPPSPQSCGRWRAVSKTPPSATPSSAPAR